ncbi:copper transporter [Demequina sp. NBRC 110053]|uniref:copper transporter n=1 Tax=Demequina sp. NBRC 110053 TaxID=1570342 RepID=UPI000A0182B3|nr:copper transporter [Demequina sp. NBRC 110053]
MKDFRYHVVSLVAVFLALAVGVVLGSGPMRDAFTGSLTEQVDALEDDLAQAQADVAAAEAQTGTARQYADESAPTMLAGALLGTPVATIGVAGPSDSAQAGVRDRLVQAGATVNAELTIEPVWTDPSQSAFRSSLASTIAPNVVGVDDATSTPTVLAHALAQALMPGVYPTGFDESALSDTDFPDAENAPDRSALLMDLLTEAGLVSGVATGPVQAYALVSGTGSEDEATRAEDAGVYAALATTFAEYTGGVVVASGVDATGDLPSAVLNSPDASAAVATVVEGTEFYGQISVPLALADALAGSVGHYGPGEGRTLVPPRAG